MRRRLLLPLLFILLAAAGGLTATLLTGSSPELGLDLQGGVSVVLEPTSEADDDQLDVALEVIRTRVDALGVAEPEITRQGDAIVVQLPGVENRDRVLGLVGQTAELRFRPVLGGPIPADAESQATTTTAPGETTTTAPGETTVPGESTTTVAGDTTTSAPEETTTTAPAEDAAATATGPDTEEPTTTTEAPVAAVTEGAVGLSEGEFAGVVQEPTTTVPPDPGATTTTAPADPSATTTTAPEGAPEITPREEDTADATVTLPSKDGESLYLLGPTLATGRVIESASAEIPAGQWQVALTLRGGAEGIDLFNQAAAQCSPPNQTVCPTGALAIVLDSVVQSAPTIEEPTFDRDNVVISGQFSEREAKDLALVLRYGSLPVELERQTVQTISASLGEDSLRAGIVAGIVGLGLVALYMVFYYRALGLVVIAGLAVWGALQFSIISWLGSTQGLALTLAGVTGIIVSVGVTVDSYVVYFERLKDEVKAGRTLRTSTERAFKRAFRTILAADISSFLGAAVLFQLTVGSVRGFAFFLGLSTILDVVVAWFFTRPVVTYLSRNRTFTEARFLGVARGLAARPGQATAPAAAPAGGGR